MAGWREWINLPDIGVPWIKAKLDTGARSSSLHAFDLEEFEREGVPCVRFTIHPLQRSAEEPVIVTRPVHDRRPVRSSSGHVEDRLLVLMDLVLTGITITAEVSLSNRDEMGFRMLVGREALRQGIVVDSSRSYLGGRPPRAVRRPNRER